MKRPIDMTLAIAGLLASILLIGTIVLAYAGRDIPSAITSGDLAALGFFFSKGVGTVLSSFGTPARGPQGPPGEPGPPGKPGAST